MVHVHRTRPGAFARAAHHVDVVMESSHSEAEPVAGKDGQ